MANDELFMWRGRFSAEYSPLKNRRRKFSVWSICWSLKAQSSLPWSSPDEVRWETRMPVKSDLPNSILASAGRCRGKGGTDGRANWMDENATRGQTAQGTGSTLQVNCSTRLTVHWPFIHNSGRLFNRPQTSSALPNSLVVVCFNRTRQPLKAKFVAEYLIIFTRMVLAFILWPDRSPWDEVRSDLLRDIFN